MQHLDFLSFPLSGSSLIEASAGTGKTYTIANLYLRLVLGIDCQARDVENVLVVTFTNAATAELKGRIRDKLKQAYDGLLRGQADDRVLSRLLGNIENTELALARLEYALQKLDQAAVMTIHGFCQRMLSEHAFESGTLYTQQMILDESQWLTVAGEDYWRRKVMPLATAELAQVYGLWAGPEAMLKELRSLLYRQVTPADFGGTRDWQQLLELYADQVRQVKRWWLENDLSGQIRDAGLSARAKIGKPEFLAQVERFCLSDAIDPDWDDKGWALLTEANVAKAHKKGSNDLSALGFDRFDSLLALQEQCAQACRYSILAEALEQVRSALDEHKQRLNLIAPDDLLNQLDRALDKDDGLALTRRVAAQYPIALIDEFQDTDPLQYRVFRRIYTASSDSTLIVIGDPKQAIYGFRGADINTYIRAKGDICESRQFTLDSNWRSAPELVAAVNHLFSSSSDGFLYQDTIPFMPVSAGKSDTDLVRDEGEFSPLTLHLYRPDDKPLSWSQVQMDLAQQCAVDIRQWLQLAQHGGARLKGQAMQAGDVCVLVRDSFEAALIKQALGELDIASVFLVRRSVFASPMAYQLYLVVKALANPRHDSTVRSALATELMGVDSQTLDSWLQSDAKWQSILDAFYQWHRVWQFHGIAQALNELIHHFDIAAALVGQFDDGLRRLTDLRHLTELLQEKSTSLKGEAQLLRFFYEQLAQPDDNHESQQLRLESDGNLVQIVTLHSSKGLEYPLVWIPFACRGREAQQGVFYESGGAEAGMKVDFLNRPESLQRADHERLAEDIRLLYVGLTRASSHCAVGVWHNAANSRRGQSGLLKTALGRLLFPADASVDTRALSDRLGTLAAHPSIGLVERTSLEPVDPLAGQTVMQGPLSVAELSRSLAQSWRVTSYSALSRTQASAHDQVPMPGWDEVHESAGEEVTVNLTQDRFSFPKGAKPGSFLHGVLERIDFRAPTNIGTAIVQQGEWFGIDAPWHPVVETWLLETLATPLDSGFTLADIDVANRVVEMEFYLPLNDVKADDFNRLLAPYLGKANYRFEQLEGMLKGYIDLTLCHQGRYYVADYKSNHLGNSLTDYRPQQLHQAMVEHDYQLQAILYTLALHRWLGRVLGDYDYDRHVGGALYLFLRGMDHTGDTGVYFTKPDKALIVALDSLFEGELAPQEPQQMGLWGQ